jgi:hypothetical protein
LSSAEKDDLSANVFIAEKPHYRNFARTGSQNGQDHSGET